MTESEGCSKTFPNQMMVGVNKVFNAANTCCDYRDMRKEGNPNDETPWIVEKDTCPPPNLCNCPTWLTIAPESEKTPHRWSANIYHIDCNIDGHVYLCVYCKEETWYGTVGIFLIEDDFEFPIHLKWSHAIRHAELGTDETFSWEGLNGDITNSEASQYGNACFVLGMEFYVSDDIQAPPDP